MLFTASGGQYWILRMLISMSGHLRSFKMGVMTNSSGLITLMMTIIGTTMAHRCHKINTKDSARLLLSTINQNNYMIQNTIKILSIKIHYYFNILSININK